ncbi:MAG: hypothetical protein ACK470_02395 [Pseudanabaena sp.]|jgi:hypothetical protein
MALKIGKLEIGYRLLISLTAIAIAYAYLGSYICTLWRISDYLGISFLFTLAIIAVFAIPQSLGGLLAAIAAVITVYWQSSDITYSLITAGVCLCMYLIGFQDVRYDPAPEKKLSILEIMATLITVGFMVQTSLLVLQIPISWLTSGAIGAIAGAITLIGKQFNYIDLSQQTIWRLFGGVTVSSLAIGFITRAIIYAATKPIEFY